MCNLLLNLFFSLHGYAFFLFEAEYDEVCCNDGGSGIPWDSTSSLVRDWTVAESAVRGPPMQRAAQAKTCICSEPCLGTAQQIKWAVLEPHSLRAVSADASIARAWAVYQGGEPE